MYNSKIVLAFFQNITFAKGDTDIRVVWGQLFSRGRARWWRHFGGFPTFVCGWMVIYHATVSPPSHFWSQTHAGQHVLSDFNKTGNCRQSSVKCPKIIFYENQPSGSRLGTSRQTWPDWRNFQNLQTRLKILTSFKRWLSQDTNQPLVQLLPSLLVFRTIILVRNMTCMFLLKLLLTACSKACVVFHTVLIMKYPVIITYDFPTCEINNFIWM